MSEPLKTAAPKYRGDSLGRKEFLSDRFRATLYGIPDLARQFHKEGVFFYLLLIVGLMVIFGALFLAIESSQHSGMGFYETLVQGGYWAAVTLATVGYGDIVPRTIAGRVMAIVLIFLAMGFVALFTANITSALTAKKLREARGLSHAKGYMNHLLVLGWKKGMSRILLDMMSRKEVPAADIVVVCDITAEQAEDISSFPELSGVRLVRGRYYSEETLRLVSPHTASTVLILADESGAEVSESEIDSRTVLTAMNLARVVKTGHVVAELLDPGYEPYLKNTRVVDEIIYPRVYGKRLLKCSATSKGVVNTINALIEGRDGVRLMTYTVPGELVGKTYGDLRAHMEQYNPGALLIGVLENAGKYAERKSEAIREAQLTPDIDKLVSNLQHAKMLENNTPRINPPATHNIQPHTLAIAIESPMGK